MLVRANLGDAKDLVNCVREVGIFTLCFLLLADLCSTLLVSIMLVVDRSDYLVDSAWSEDM